MLHICNSKWSDRKISSKQELTLEFCQQEVIVGPKNRAAISNDKFLRVNLVGDYVGYTDIPSFENFFLVIPRQVVL